MTKHNIHVPAAAARVTDPETSQWAAETVRTRRQMYHLLRTLRNLTRVYPHAAGFTDEYIHSFNCCISDFSDTAQGLRSRRADAVKLGLVEMADRLGETETGRACKRWRLTNKGMDVARQIMKEANNE